MFPDDHDAYAAFCAQSERGEWLFANPYRKDDNPAVYFNPLWLAMGKFQQVTGLTYPVGFQFLRLIACLWLACAAFAWLKRLSPKSSPLAHLLGLTLFLTASGGGWLFQLGWLLLHAVPPDTHTEMYPFVQAAFVPHAALSHAMLMTALLFATSTTHGKHKRNLLAGGLLALLFTIRPYDALVGWLALILVWTITTLTRYFGKKPSDSSQSAPSFSKPSFLSWLIPVPALGYTFWLTQYSTGFSSWSEGNVYPFPAPGSFAISLGLLWIFAPLGLFFAFRKKRPWQGTNAIVSAWMLVAWILLLVPVVPWSWRVAGMAISPLLLLATSGWLTSPGRWKIALVGLAIPAMIPTNLHLSSDLNRLAVERNKYLFMQSHLFEAFEALDQLAPGLVFTHGSLGQKVPIFTRHRSFLGHKDIMPNYREGLRLYQQYGNEPSIQKRSRVLNEHRIDYILYTYLDRKWTRYPPGELTGWRKVYSDANSSIYANRRLDHLPQNTGK